MKKMIYKNSNIDKEAPKRLREISKKIKREQFNFYIKS